MSWNHAQDAELDFWGDCLSTIVEEQKQLFIANRLKLNFLEYPLSRIDMEGKSVIDVGSGPVSLLLKCRNFSKAVAVDPLMGKFPAWVRYRYEAAGITPLAGTGEALELVWAYSPFGDKFDECMIYNVLQHTIDPELIISNALKVAKTLRIFEYVDIPSDEKHPHVLKADKLDLWLGKKGVVEELSEPYMYGTCYYNVVEGK